MQSDGSGGDHTEDLAAWREILQSLADTVYESTAPMVTAGRGWPLVLSAFICDNDDPGYPYAVGRVGTVAPEGQAQFLRLLADHIDGLADGEESSRLIVPWPDTPAADGRIP